MTIQLRNSPGRPPRVVIDTAVVVSALVFGGGSAALLRRAWQSGRCRPMVCKTTLADLAAKLAHPRLQLSRSEHENLIGEYLPHAVRVRVAAADEGAAAGDPMALAFARLAMAGRAHALVSGDPELLALGVRFICPVLTLDDFLEALKRPRTPTPAQ
ncbi:MAG: PIN domain-containing protein [Burkholderiales bacterium]